MIHSRKLVLIAGLAALASAGAAQAREFKPDYAYPMVQGADCEKLGGEVYKPSSVTYCKVPIKIPTDACEVLNSLDTSIPVNSDVKQRIQQVEYTIRSAPPYGAGDGKRGVLSARRALLAEFFARDNPRAWDMEAGFTPSASTSGPMSKAYRHYLTWIQHACVALKLKPTPLSP